MKLLSMIAALIAFVVPAHAVQTLAIVGATVIDGTGKAPMSDGVVLIRDRRIAAIGRSLEVAIPAGAKRLNAQGKYVIPGLMEGVNQGWWGGDAETLVRYEGRLHELYLEGAQISLKSGLTAAFIAWMHAPAMKARDLINSGEATGARLYVRGTLIGVTFAEAIPGVSKAFAQRMSEEFNKGMDSDLAWMTPAEVRAKVRAYIQEQHIDFLKYGASTGVGPFLTFSPRVQRAIVEEGHRAGLTVQAHTVSVEAMDQAIEAGVDILTHGDITSLNNASAPKTLIPEETIQKLLARHIAVGVLPESQRYLDLVEKYCPGRGAGGLNAQDQRVAMTNRRNMIKAGVTMLLGTEAVIVSPDELAAASATMPSDAIEACYSRGNLGEAHIYALIALEEEGMDPMEILKTATSNVARAYKLKDLGTLEPGKIADVVILDANPLESARNYGRVHAVIKEGRVVDRDTLPVVRHLTATTH